MRNFLRRLLGKRPIEKGRNVFEIADRLAEYDDWRESRGVVGNVEIKVNSRSNNFSEDLQKFEGVYPLELTSGQYRVLYDENPKKGLPTIKAAVDEHEQNIRFARGIRKDVVNKYIHVHGHSSQIHKEHPLLEVDVVPHVNSLEDCDELGITKGEAIYIFSKEQKKNHRSTVKRLLDRAREAKERHKHIWD